MVPEFDWMNERVEKTIDANWLYNTICLFLGRRTTKLTYKELYLILRSINEKNLGEEESDKASLSKVIEIYKYNNGVLPLGI